MLVRNAWESEFFNRKIYSLDETEWNARAFQEEVNAHKPDLVVAKVSVDDSALLKELIINGFVIEEVAVDFARSLTAGDVLHGSAFEIATSAHIDELKNIASESLIHSRFNNDVFGPCARQRLYETWVEKAVAGQYDDVCLMVRSGGAVAGFITCRALGDNECRVGLLAVRPSCQGMGFGGMLLQSVSGYAFDNGCKSIRIATQYVNKPAMRLYSKYGYLVESIDLIAYRYCTKSS